LVFAFFKHFPDSEIISEMSEVVSETPEVVSGMSEMVLGVSEVVSEISEAIRKEEARVGQWSEVVSIAVGVLDPDGRHFL
jgi:hypothetical protein